MPQLFINTLINRCMLERIQTETRDSIINSLKEIKKTNELDPDEYKQNNINEYPDCFDLPLHNYQCIYSYCVRKFGINFSIYRLLCRYYGNKQQAINEFKMMKASLASNLYRQYFDEDDSDLIDDFDLDDTMTEDEKKETFKEYMDGFKVVILRIGYIHLLYTKTDEYINSVMNLWNRKNPRNLITINDIIPHPTQAAEED